MIKYNVMFHIDFEHIEFYFIFINLNRGGGGNNKFYLYPCADLVQGSFLHGELSKKKF